MGDGPQTSEKISSRGELVFMDDIEKGSLWLLLIEKELQ